MDFPVLFCFLKKKHWIFWKRHSLFLYTFHQDEHGLHKLNFDKNGILGGGGGPPPLRKLKNIPDLMIFNGDIAP